MGAKRDVQDGGDICMYLWLIHGDVQQEQTICYSRYPLINNKFIFKNLKKKRIQEW